MELASVIEHPAQRVGLRIEAGLADALLADLGEEPGILPLLETALLELWQAREGGRLTLAAYRASGGVHGAVARLAEDAYGALDRDQQSIARSVFLRLSGPGEGERVVRRRVPVAEFDTEREPQVLAVIEALTNGRLLTSGDGFVGGGSRGATARMACFRFGSRRTLPDASFVSTSSTLRATGKRGAARQVTSIVVPV